MNSRGRAEGRRWLLAPWSLTWLGGLSLDLKLGFRMLARYPGLTLVAGAAMAFGIAAGAGAFQLRVQIIDPSLPLDEGSRIVGLRNWDASLNRPVLLTPDEFTTWRAGLTRIEDVSAFTLFSRNLVTDDGRSEVHAVAALSASAFVVTRVLPQLGRTLLEADEHPGAPPVIVIGHDVWQQRFAGDPAAVGRVVRLGSEPRTVVGVMPKGFAFPAAHGLWVPLTRPAAGVETTAPELLVFGRLAHGTSRNAAQAELTATRRPAITASDEREHVRPQVVPFTWLVFDPGELQLGLALGNVFVVMLVVLVSANVALLMFARAVARESEIAVRSALGAGRARIVTQLFVEAFVLAGVAAAVGVGAARLGLRSFLTMYEADSGRLLPFWMSDSLTPTTVIYAGVLTSVSAAIIGVLPALQVTGRGQLARLRQATAGSGGVPFGGLWTLVIAAQVAVTLAFPASAFFLHRWVVNGQTRDLGFVADDYLSARLEMDREHVSGVRLDVTEQAFRSRVHNTYAELKRRVSAQPDVVGLTFADRLPGTLHSRWRIETDDEASTSSAPVPRVVSASVAVDFFEVLGAPILAGRAFTDADPESASGVVIVNQSFANRVLAGRNPIGRRIRRLPSVETPQSGPWLEIVGMVKDLGMVGGDDGAGFYRPISPERASALRLAIRVRGPADAFAARLRALGGEVNPALQFHEVMPLKEAGADLWLESQYLSRLLTVLSAIALLLSLTAIYSVMAFTVSRRTREIGLRVALGADRLRVIGVILRRPLVQVSLGIVMGGILVTVMFVGLFESTPTATEAAVILAYSMLMMGVSLLAGVVPARRALRVEPARALTSEG